jgi:hypothetical protein
MEADKVRNWVRGRGMGRGCRRGVTGGVTVSSTVRMPGKGKEKPCDVVGVAGALPVSQDPDPDDAQDMVGLGSAWVRAYSGSNSSRGSGNSRSGVKLPGVDAGESRDRDGGNGERERRIATKRSVGDEDNGLKSASNASRSSSSPGAGVPTLSSSSIASSSSSSSSMVLARYVLVATNPWASSFFTCPTARAVMRAYTVCFTAFFLAARRSVICALRSRARVRAHWHALVLAVENGVDGTRLADDEVGIGVAGLSVCVVFVLGLGLMQRRRNRMEKKRLRA